MVLVNTDYITGKELETICLVSGSSFRSGDVFAHAFDISDVNVKEAVSNMVAVAQHHAADGIINIKYSFAPNYAFVAGTAVRFV